MGLIEVEEVVGWECWGTIGRRGVGVGRRCGRLMFGCWGQAKCSSRRDFVVSGYLVFCVGFYLVLCGPFRGDRDVRS